ncbi:MAG: L-histidine N(alpha)-methyltransferase [Bacteroidales bacterium]|nr:L-histidine N(alpha)-methyltransferase [Bacteroidales bacterium]
MQTTIQQTQFAEDVNTGLSASHKYLNSKYFYDTHGSIIFQKIMHMPEYYLTDCELEIFEKQASGIYEAFRVDHQPFDVVELGAGDGLKTTILLMHIFKKNPKIRYMPIDISNKAVEMITEKLTHEIPGLEVLGKTGDYFEMMEELSRIDKTPKVLLFLGSNIGNFNDGKARSFLGELHAAMNPADKLFIGFDLKKDPRVILDAYNDPHGYTASFNLNLLRRINEELGANFEIMKFRHHEVYDPQTGTAKSYLISLEKQDVRINSLDRVFHFEKWEPVFMEMSQKYDFAMIEKFASGSGFTIEKNFTDSKNYFLNSLWKLK